MAEKKTSAVEERSEECSVEAGGVTRMVISKYSARNARGMGSGDISMDYTGMSGKEEGWWVLRNK